MRPRHEQARRPVALGTLLVALGILAAACGGPETAAIRLEQEGRTLDIRAEVAATPDERARGLMHRNHLGENEGMIFLFPDVAPRSFWMKNTLIPLDIAFIRAGTVVSVATMEPCEADPCPHTTSGEPADAALEVPAGVFERAGIGPGARVSIFGTLPPVR